MNQTSSNICDSCGKTKHDCFMAHLEESTLEVQKTFEQAQKAYESVLKNFITQNITGNDQFEFFYDEASIAVRESYAMDKFVIDDLLILDWMIYDFQSFLKNYDMTVVKH